MALKSVRIPDDLIAFIEKQPGKDFSKKLVGMLNSYRELVCNTERQNQVRDYNKTVNDIERLALQLINANRKLSDISHALDGTPVYQLSFNPDFSEIIADNIMK